MKVKTFTKRNIATEIADRLEATVVDSLMFTDELFTVLREMLTEDHEKVRIEIRNFGVFEVKPTKAKPKARNPHTNEEIFVPATIQPKPINSNNIYGNPCQKGPLRPFNR